jgi:hypothetical protein
MSSLLRIAAAMTLLFWTAGLAGYWYSGNPSLLAGITIATVFNLSVAAFAGIRLGRYKRRRP